MLLVLDSGEVVVVRTRCAILSRAVCAVALLAVIFVAAISAAHSADLDRLVTFNIQAKTLDKALLQFGSQAHLQLSFAPNSETIQLRTEQLKGRYTAKAALAKLLKGTGLWYVVREQTIEILPAAPSPTATSSSPSSVRGDVPFRHSSRADEPSLGEGDPSLTSEVGEGPFLREIVVTGSRLLTDEKEGPQEVQIYDSQRIDESGQPSVSDFLSTLPSVSTTLPAVSAAGYTSTVALRGLPVGTTLVLLDGRRVQDSGADGGLYFDLSNIPLAAVQRIEIDENGSSAVYGSDAIAGVVNIILKKDFNGFAVNARYGWAKDIRDISSSLAAGRQWERGGLSMIASYETDGGLLNLDRRLSSSNNYTNYAGPDNNYPICFPGNVFAKNGNPLPGASAGSTATYAAITGNTASGQPAFSQFSYGSLNECSLLSGLSLLPAQERGALFLQGHLSITSNVSLFTEVMYTHLNRTAGSGYARLSGTAAFQAYTVSAANPFNPFGEPVGVTEQLYDVPVLETLKTSFFRPLVGLRGTIAAQWQWEVSTWQSTDWTQFVGTNEFPNHSAIQGALNSSSTNTALNPFVTGATGSPALLQSLYSNENQELMGSDRSAEAWIRGPLVTVPAGAVQVVFGGDYVRSTLHQNTSGGSGVYASYDTTSNYQRRYSAVFAEAKIPLVARKTSETSILDLTASGRRDQYSDFGSHTTAQAGVELRPLTDLLIRSTYGTAFAAPVLSLLDSPAFSTSEFITDPITGQSNFIQVKTGGNPKLSPMTGRSHTVGVVYASSALPGLQLSLTQWNIVETDVTQAVDAQVIVDNEGLFPGRVIRDSSGQIIDVDDTELNFGSIDVGGIDYQLDYSHQIGVGVGSVELGATEIYHYRQALVPGSSPVESVSQAQNDDDWAPRWKGAVGLGWSSKAFAVHVDSQYTSSYVDYAPPMRIGNFWIVDANIHWSIGEWFAPRSSLLTGAYAEAGGTNIFNKAAQFSNYGYDFYGYDAWEMSPVGRSLYVTVGSRW